MTTIPDALLLQYAHQPDEDADPLLQQLALELYVERLANRWYTPDIGNPRDETGASAVVLAYDIDGNPLFVYWWDDQWCDTTTGDPVKIERWRYLPR